MRLCTTLAAVLMCLFLTGCSIMSPVKMGPDSGYVINAVPHPVVRSSRHINGLLVMTPETNPVFNSTRMAFTLKPYQITYYSDSRWIEAPSDMLTPLLIQTMQQTNHFTHVISPPFGGHYEYALRTNIKSLLIDYTQRRPVLRLILSEQLMRVQSGRVIASRTFTAAEPLPARSPYGAVIAANRATEQLLAQIAIWCVRNTQ